MAATKMSTLWLVFAMAVLPLCMAATSANCEGTECFVFFLERVSREQTEEGKNKFTVQFYNTTDEDRKVNWYFSADPGQNLEGTLEMDGSSIVASVEVPAQEWTTVRCQLLSARISYELDIDNAQTSERLQTFFHVPVFNITPPEEIVYKDGQESIIEIEHWKLYTYSPIYDSLTASFYLVSPYTGKLGNSRPPNFWTDIGAVTDGPYTTSYSSLNTSFYPASGVVDFYVSIGQPGHLISRATYGKRMVLRPENQAGAFPSGFLQVVDNFQHDVDANGGEILYCSTAAHAVCIVPCTGASEDLKSVTLRQVEADGSLTDLASETALPGSLMTFVSASVKSDVVTTLSAQCEAVNSAGESDVMDYQVVFYEPATIVREESGISPYNDTMVEITCKYNGDPEPTAYFSLAYKGEEPRTYHPEVFQTTSDGFVAKLYALKELPADDSENSTPRGLCVAACNVFAFVGHSSSTVTSDFYTVPHDC